MIKACIFIVLISTYSIVFLDEATVVRLGVESGPVENMGAVFFLISSVFLFIIYSKSSGAGNSFGKFHTKRNIFYFLLGLFCFMCFGEEISWGQHMMGWDTPAGLKERNVQGETNLHNLDIFYDKSTDFKNTGNHPTFNMTTLFSAFLFSYFILVPLVNKFFRPANKFFKYIGLPCPPFWIAGLFLANYIAQKITRIDSLLIPMSKLRTLNELKESNYAFNLAVFGFYELKNIIASSKDRVRSILPN
jgi:hypothetical protein